MTSKYEREVMKRHEEREPRFLPSPRSTHSRSNRGSSPRENSGRDSTTSSPEKDVTVTAKVESLELALAQSEQVASNAQSKLRMVEAELEIKQKQISQGIKMTKFQVSHSSLITMSPLAPGQQDQRA